jgi:hypothetical protein
MDKPFSALSILVQFDICTHVINLREVYMALHHVSSDFSPFVMAKRNITVCLLSALPGVKPYTDIVECFG